MLNELKFIKSGKCSRKAWLIENTGACEHSRPMPFPSIKKGEKNKSFRSQLGETTVGCVVQKKNGIELYDFYDTVKFRKYAVRTNFKRAIAESCGYNVLAAFVVTINPNYEKGGRIPYYIINRIDKPKSKTEFVKCIERVRDAAAGNCIPNAEMKNDCAGCEFFKGCFKLPKDNIFLLKGINFPDKIKLYENGIISFDDYLKNDPSPVCKMQITGETHIDKAAIRGFLSKLKYPLGFLDFETISPIKPNFPGYHPGDKIITQFSYHQRNRIGEAVLHREFIGDGITNPEPAAVKELISAAKSAGSILSYSVYEKNCIEMLEERFPQYKRELKEIADKLVDLEIPFKTHMYYTPLMDGRTSLKYVLPALYPDDNALSYRKMSISDGDAAIKAYMGLKDKSESEREKIKSNLKKYCSLDTFALVKIIDKLYEVI